MILAIVFAFMAYKKANAIGRSGIGWAAIAAGTFIGTQLIVSLGLGIAIGLFMGISGTAEDTRLAEIGITIFAIIVSIIAGWLVLRYLDRIPLQENFNAPPPPPNFRGE